MKYAELHYFADERLVQDGCPLFVWGAYDVPDDAGLPDFRNTFGRVVVIASGDTAPGKYSRYNPETNAWLPALADDAVPELNPFWSAHWDNERWTLAPRS